MIRKTPYFLEGITWVWNWATQQSKRSNRAVRPISKRQSFIFLERNSFQKHGEVILASPPSRRKTPGLAKAYGKGNKKWVIPRNPRKRRSHCDEP